MKLFSRVFTLALSLSFTIITHSGYAKPKFDPNFDENYAYDAILKYEKLGPKVPGTPAHTKAGDWIVSELKKFAASVIEQKTSAITYDKKKIPIRNIIGQFNPKAKTRFLLSAHWDNRPTADRDKVNKAKPILGVNDGGSGVVVLLGIAKAIQGQPFQNKSGDFGIDLAFWDAEDSGTPSVEDSYCLGSQYWATHPEPANYKAKFGVNYDMVGRIGSVFPMEGHTFRQAAEVMLGIKQAAKELGYADYFGNYRIGSITDDHYYIHRGRGFPVANLISITQSGEFPPEWHTHRDTSAVISRDVLKAVAQSTLLFISKE